MMKTQIADHNEEGETYIWIPGMLDVVGGLANESRHAVFCESLGQ